MNHWDAATAEWYAKNYGEYATNRLAVNELALPDAATIVDIGCGTGAALRHASRQVSRGRLIGVDPVPRMVEIAQEKTVGHPAAATIVYYVGSAEALPVNERTADYVFAFDSFDHWQEKRKGLREVGRVLKDDGRLVVVKDGNVPQDDAAKRDFLQLLEETAFHVLEAKDVVDNEISFTMWICAKRGD